jgi:hypothetical protein
MATRVSGEVVEEEVLENCDVGKGRRCEKNTPLYFRDLEDLSKLLEDLSARDLLARDLLVSWEEGGTFSYQGPPFAVRSSER